MSLGHKVFQAFHDVADRVMPTQTASNFLEKGMLTPEEFVLAGDQLVHTCATWEWVAGDPAKARPYMPEDKQYLVTRGVPSMQRAQSIQVAADLDAAASGAGEVGAADDDEWCIAGDAFAALRGGGRASAGGDDEFLDVPSGGSSAAADKGLLTAVPPTPPTAAPTTAPTTAAASDSDDEYADLDDFEEENLLLEPEDAAALEAASAAAASAAADDNIVKTRTYDVSITYDNYYRTPRVWLYGYDPDRRPLSPEEIFEDIVKDYVQRTVTIEAHPHAVGSEPHASIHPCRHAAAMKRIVDQLTAGGSGGAAGDAPTFDIGTTLFMFLKFMQVRAPTSLPRCPLVFWCRCGAVSRTRLCVERRRLGAPPSRGVHASAAPPRPSHAPHSLCTQCSPNKSTVRLI